MKAIIWKVAPKLPSKWNKGCFNQVIIFKSLDDDKQYKLNLDSRFPIDVARWLVDCQAGNVLEITMNHDTKNVDLFKHHTLIERKQQSLIKQVEYVEGHTLETEPCECLKDVIKKIQEHEAHERKSSGSIKTNS